MKFNTLEEQVQEEARTQQTIIGFNHKKNCPTKHVGTDRQTEEGLLHMTIGQQSQQEKNTKPIEQHTAQEEEHLPTQQKENQHQLHAGMHGGEYLGNVDGGCPGCGAEPTTVSAEQKYTANLDQGNTPDTDRQRYLTGDKKDLSGDMNMDNTPYSGNVQRNDKTGELSTSSNQYDRLKNSRRFSEY
jgi:hypothetical protein